MKNKKLAIIGGSGSIGKHLVKHFGKKNILVLSSKKKKNFKFFDLNKEINEAKLKKIFHKVETVIFCSSLKIENNKKKIYTFNYINFKNFLRIFKKLDKKLIYLSTASIYPKNTNFICNEKMRAFKNKMTGNFYSYTKYLAEKEIIKIMKKKSFLILRIGAIYGLNSNVNEWTADDLDADFSLLYGGDAHFGLHSIIFADQSQHADGHHTKLYGFRLIAEKNK